MNESSTPTRPFWKRWQFWVGLVAGLVILGAILPKRPKPQAQQKTPATSTTPTKTVDTPTTTKPSTPPASGMLVSGDELRAQMPGLSWSPKQADAGETKYRGEVEHKGIRTIVTARETGSKLTYVRATVMAGDAAIARPTLTGVAKLSTGGEVEQWVAGAVGGKDQIADVGPYHVVYTGGSQHMLTISVR